MIPDVISDVLDDAGGQIAALAKRLAEPRRPAPVADRVRRLGLRRAGRRAGLPEALRPDRAPGARAGPGQVPGPGPAARQRGDRPVLLGQGRPDDRGGRAGPPGRSPCGRADQRRGRPACAGQRRGTAAGRAHAGFLAGHVHLRGDARHPAAARRRAGRAARRHRPADGAARPAAGAGRGDPDGGRRTRDRGRRGTAPGRAGSRSSALARTRRPPGSRRRSSSRARSSLASRPTSRSGRTRSTS